VIHFNFGLHDMKREDPESGRPSGDPEHPRQAGLETYEKQLRQIVARLRKTGAKLIFATTTPVPPGGVRPHRDVEDPARYNEAACRIMKDNDVAIDDLYAFATARLERIQQPVNVHFTKKGSQALAREVVKHIRRALE
jgi:acyl-CoA thioesterase-1